MTDENRFLPVGIGDWGRNFASQAPWVQAMTKDYSSKVYNSIAPAMDQASKTIAEAVRPCFQQMSDPLAEQGLNPYLEAIRAVFPTVPVSQEAIGEVVRNLTAAVESGDLSDEFLAGTQQEYEELFPQLESHTGQWPAWVDAMAWRLFVVILDYVVSLVVLGYIDEHTAWGWLAGFANSVLDPQGFTKRLVEEWKSRPGPGDQATGDERR